jgi:PhzF family phenazine biosynthesis protein
MKIKTFILDTFTSIPFSGNPTAICYCDNDIEPGRMQLIAGELGFPVTAFIKKNNIGKDEYKIRYFTVTTEIPACGHATLGAAAVVFNLESSTIINFQTIDNLIINIRKEDQLIVMNYPKYELTNYKIPDELIRSLQISGYKSAGYCSELETLFIELDNPEILKSVKPDYARMVAADENLKEVVITSISDNRNYDFFLRSFCPWIGINEDPVTGSVHSVLAGYWKRRLGKDVLKAYQASERGGEIKVKSFEDKVELGGNCVILLNGELDLTDKEHL